MKLIRVVLGAAVLSLGGCTCETVSSADIKTSGLYADLEANADGDGHTTVKATLTLDVGSLTFLELSSGDSLTASSGSETRAMARKRLFGSTWYEADFSGDEANKPFSVNLTRTSDTSAPVSSVTLPAPLTFTAPMASQAFSRAAGARVGVAWTPSGLGDPMTVSASGSCIDSVSALDVTSDNGQYVLPAFTARQGEDSKSCSVVVTLTRRRSGSVDAAYGKGGTFVATVKRTITVTSDP